MEYELHYLVVELDDMPPPHPPMHKAVRCMPPPRCVFGEAQRILRGYPHSCCEYHQGDWRLVSAVAVDAVEKAVSEGLSGEAVGHRARELGQDSFLVGEQKRALRSLLGSDSISLDFSPLPRYVNGRHRTQAMKDMGVERTVITTYLPVGGCVCRLPGITP